MDPSPRYGPTVPADPDLTSANGPVTCHQVTSQVDTPTGDVIRGRFPKRLVTVNPPTPGGRSCDLFNGTSGTFCCLALFVLPVEIVPLFWQIILQNPSVLSDGRSI